MGKGGFKVLLLRIDWFMSDFSLEVMTMKRVFMLSVLALAPFSHAMDTERCAPYSVRVQEIPGLGRVRVFDRPRRPQRDSELCSSELCSKECRAECAHRAVGMAATAVFCGVGLAGPGAFLGCVAGGNSCAAGTAGLGAMIGAGSGGLCGLVAGSLGIVPGAGGGLPPSHGPGTPIGAQIHQAGGFGAWITR